MAAKAQTQQQRCALDGKQFSYFEAQESAVQAARYALPAGSSPEPRARRSGKKFPAIWACDGCRRIIAVEGDVIKP